MSVRTRYGIKLAISSSYQETKDLGNVLYEVVTDSQSMGGVWKTTVKAGTTNAQLQMDNLSNVQLLMLRTNVKDPTLTPVPLTFYLNSLSNTPFIVQPLGDALEGHFLISTTGVTALYVTNSGAVDMDVSIGVAGN